MATIEYSTDDGSTWTEVSYQKFWIENGNGRNTLSNKAKIWVDRGINITANDLIRIKIDGVNRFEGITINNGKFNANSKKIYDVRGYGYEFMDEEVSLNLSSTSPENILSNILPSEYTLNTSTATGITIDSYNVSKRKKNILRDVLDRTGYIIRFESDKNVYFEPISDRGSLATFDAQNNNVAVMRWEENSVDTVINKVKVFGTNENRKVEGSAEDSTSITNYGERSQTYNFNYIASSSEANNIASSLLKPNPRDKGKIRGAKDRYYSDNIVNYELDLIDSSKNISSTVTVIKQRIYDGYIELQVGLGEDFNVDEYNRNSRSNKEKSESGGQWSDIYDDGNKPVDNATENKTFYQSTAPSGAGESAGDIWIDSDTGTPYVYEDGSWNRTVWEDVSSDPDAPENNATKNELIRQSTEPDPGSYEDGDMWVDSDNGNPYIHDGDDWQRTTWELISTDSNAPDDNADVTSDNKGVWDYSDWLAKIDADHWFEGNVIVDGTIGATEIAANTITANEISTLDLDTDELTVGADKTYQFEFGEFQTSGETAMVPDTDLNCYIGTDLRSMKGIYSDGVHTDFLYSLNDSEIQLVDAITGKMLLDIFSQIGSDYANPIGFQESGGEIRIIPETDNTCQVGASGNAFLSMWSYNFNTASPERFGDNKDPLKDIQDYEVNQKHEKDLPGYVKEINDNGKEGMNIGNMTSWLLEQNKAQQRIIEKQEKKLNNLEERIKKLEDRE